MPQSPVAVVAGVGPGLGKAVADRFAAEGYRVAILARSEEKLEALAGNQTSLYAYPCDLTVPVQVSDAFTRIERDLGTPSCVVFNAGKMLRGGAADLDPADFERCWRVGCYGGFLVGKAAARLMQPRGEGTILFTGATASLRGGSGFMAFASAKFGLRAVAQSLARELGPQGIHVAHVIIDGQIRAEVPADDGTYLNAGAIADAYWTLHRQPKSAWSFELDLRPYGERF